MTDKKTFRISEKRRILLVEDDIVCQEMMKASIGETYSVVIAETGEEALEVIRAQHETLSMVLLDLNLPGITGIDVLSRIKSDPASSRLPVIVMTSDHEAEVECLTLGAIDFIPKPYPASKVILARILRTVELSEDRETLRLTERDQLTGLYNKEFFYRYAAQLDLYHKDAPVDAIVFDVNHFHTINDRFGKARGNEVLKRIAVNATDYVNEAGGIVCRSGADTFLLYCRHIDDHEALLARLSAGLDDVGFGKNRVRLRMGVYVDADKTIDIERRFDRAKMAADTARDHLTAPVGFFDHSMREAEILEEQLIDDFKAAISQKQFAVFFQPKFDVRRDEPVLASAEALVRWKHPKLGMVSPGVFIPLFEKNGLIQELDHYVWAQTAAHIKAWKDRLKITLPVSVNVSRIDLYDPELTERFLDIAKKNKISTEDLLLEITESAYTEKTDFIIKTVKDLRRLGFRIEMDDFGSGYSSLSMLSNMPIDALKLDMQFIRSAFSQRKDTRLLEAMIGLARSFGVPTIAEGVETAEQYSNLKAMGCDLIQGYYFSRPLPADEFEEFIVKNLKKNLKTEGVLC
ncbi:MAG: EAL domain-containing protein [Clostridia bacterium]|nr:EAL domain-containing protein [Clostridia bacterium]